MTLDHCAGAGMQVAGARVIAEPSPGGENLAELGARQRLDVRPGAEEEPVARQHGLDRGLLQHDLAQPHAVGIGARAGLCPPGEMPPLAVVPGEQRIGDCRSSTVRLRGCAPLHNANSSILALWLMV